MRRGAERRGIGSRVVDRIIRVVLADDLSRTAGSPPAHPARAVRWNPGRRGVLAVAAVAALSVTGAGAWVLSAQPQRLPTMADVTHSSGPPATPVEPGRQAVNSVTSPPRPARPASSGSTELVVDVVGRVRHPGIYRLPAGSRVNDAILAAGGAAGGLNMATVNLARRLTDGEQLAIGVAGAGVPPAEGNPGAAAAPGPTFGADHPLDLNSATETQLDALPGVGPVLAQRIVEWRTAHERFSSVDQLRSVTGIGDSKFADLKPLVIVT